MKFIIDPVYTADLDNCSCAYKSKQIVKYLGDKIDDAFFYWFVPAKTGKEFEWDEAWFPHAERVQLIQIPMYRDRIREYSHYPQERAEWFSPFGPNWDWDFCLTARIPQIPSLQMMSHRWGAPYPEQHRFIGYDGFPLFSFKDAIPNANTELTELNGYMAADRSFLFSFWERSEILKRARHYLTPSQVIDLSHKLLDALPHQAWKVQPKSDAYIAKVASGKKRFTVGYTQRIERERRRTDEVFELWTKFWIIHSENMRFVSSSATNRTAVTVPDFVERFKLPREEFHALLDNEVDVTTVFSTDEGYPLSVVEPLVHGVPGIIYKARYAVNVLGDDYPFFFTQVSQAYGFLQAFKEDYTGMYAIFRKWLVEKFQGLIDERAETFLPESVARAVYDLEVQAEGRFDTEALRANDVLAQLPEHYPHIAFPDGTWTIRDFFHRLADEGYFQQITKNDVYWDGHDNHGQLSRVFQRQLYRKLLRFHRGCRDASLVPGHMTKPIWD